MKNYNDFAMDALEGGPDEDQGAGPAGAGLGPAAPPKNDIRSITIKKAKNGFTVDVDRVQPSTKGGGSIAPSEPELHLAKSPVELVGLVDQLFGIKGQKPAPPKPLAKPATEPEEEPAPEEGEGDLGGEGGDQGGDYGDES